MTSLALLAIGQLLAFLLLAAAAWGAGTAAIRPSPTVNRSEAVAVAAAGGLGLLGSALFLAGLAGALHRWLVLALAVAGLALGARSLAARRARVTVDGAGGPQPGGDVPGTAALGIAGAGALLPAFVLGLFPPTGFDATTYHLPFAHAFVEAHRLVVVPELLFPVFPQLAEVLFAAMLLATGTDVAAHLVQLLAMALTALLLFAAGRRFFSPWAGVWAAALWIAHPLVHYQAASAYVDLVLALFCLLAVHSWEVWREERAKGEAAARAGAGWLALSGAAAGFAAATKYLGLAWLGLLVVFTLVVERKRRFAAAGLLLLVALAAAGPWYARIHHHTGNPVHPLLEPLFTGGDRDSRFDRIVGLESGMSPIDGVGAVAGAAARALARVEELPVFAWRASFDRHAFSRQSPLAPWHLVLVPLAAVFCWRDRRLLRWLLVVVVYALLWTTHDPRFQLPSMALLALAGAGAIHHLGRRLPSLGRRLTRPAVAWSLALLLAAPGPLYALYKIGRHGPLPPASPQARKEFLDREVSGHAAIRRLNRLDGGRYTVFTVNGQYLAYFAEGRLLGHVLGPFNQGRVTRRLGDARRLHQELLSMDVDYLLVVHDRRRIRLPHGEEFDRRFRPLGGDGRYELFALLEPEAGTGSDS